MTTVERTALCTVDWCAHPTDPDWHVCIVCGALAVQHAHVESRSHNPARRKDKANQVILCVPHHQEVDLRQNGTHGHAIRQIPGRGRLYFRFDLHGNTTFQKILTFDGADDTDSHSSVQPSVPSQAVEGTPPQGTPLVQIASVPSTVFAGPGPIICTDVGARPGPALMNAEGADLSSNAAPLTPSAFSLEDWMEQGRCLRDEGLHLRKLTTEWAFRVGDWWNTGEREWPHESSQMMDELGLSYWQITKFGSVAARVPPENRLSRDKSELLTVEHYRAVANLPPESQPEALEVALDEGMSASGLKLWIAEKEGAMAIVVPETHACPDCGALHRRKP